MVSTYESSVAVTACRFPRSQDLFDSARDVIPGGVTSSIRAGERPHPIYFSRGEGAYLWDVDGGRYIDYALGYGPLILGHAPSIVTAAVKRQLALGLTFGAQHALEPELAALLVDVIPGAEQAIVATTGTEAVAAAIRLARSVTGRRLVLKFEGHYHGWFDGVFVSVAFDAARAGPTARPVAVPATIGIPDGACSPNGTIPTPSTPYWQHTRALSRRSYASRSLSTPVWFDLLTGSSDSCADGQATTAPC
jgi:glutamate-1-semialdehyde 2,1-aminomutase